jgi:hypothetical protein
MPWRSQGGLVSVVSLTGGPRVRIRLPPAASQVRTRPHGFGNLPPASHAPAPPVAGTARKSGDGVGLEIIAKLASLLEVEPPELVRGAGNRHRGFGSTSFPPESGSHSVSESPLILGKTIVVRCARVPSGVWLELKVA